MLRKALSLALLLHACGCLGAQDVSAFRKISRPEKRWALAHPFAAKKAFKLTRFVLHVCDSLRNDTSLDGDMNGGQLDAFRHAYWMCLLTQHIPAKKAYKLGVAHEKGNMYDFKRKDLEENVRPDSMACVMDLINDQLGIQFGLGNVHSKKRLSDTDLVGLIINEVRGGHMSILLKNKEGRFVTCDGDAINMADYRDKWNVPKCLAKSDFINK
ncbi:MAG TPA: hypothetical protein VI112_05285 [Bacteroidia bacterium]